MVRSFIFLGIMLSLFADASDVTAASAYSMKNPDKAHFPELVQESASWLPNMRSDMTMDELFKAFNDAEDAGWRAKCGREIVRRMNEENKTLTIPASGRAYAFIVKKANPKNYEESSNPTLEITAEFQEAPTTEGEMPTKTITKLKVTKPWGFALRMTNNTVNIFTASGSGSQSTALEFQKVEIGWKALGYIVSDIILVRSKTQDEAFAQERIRVLKEKFDPTIWNVPDEEIERRVRTDFASRNLFKDEW